MVYRVTVKCVVYKVLTCEDCTEEQARTDPWDHAVHEVEQDQLDWEVLYVKADEEE